MNWAVTNLDEVSETLAVSRRAQTNGDAHLWQKCEDQREELEELKDRVERLEATEKDMEVGSGH